MGRTSALRFTGSSLSPMPTRRGTSTSPMTTSGSSHSAMTHGRGVPSSELALALRRSRSGITREGDDRLFRAAFTNIDARQRWEPEVRIDTAIASLMSGVAFTRSSDEFATWWHVDSPNADDGSRATNAVRLVRLKAPPRDVLLNAQLPMVFSAAEQRDDRLPEILSQAEGLWPFWTSVINLDGTLAPATVELVETLLNTTHLMVMRMKYELKAPRPVDLSSTIEPIIPTPGHGSFPSGHATVSFMFAGFMRRLLNLDATKPEIVCLQRMAHRIAQNRVAAGVHFPTDSVAGRLLGETLAEYFFARCVKADGANPANIKASYLNASFDGNAGNVNLDDEPDATAFATRVNAVGSESGDVPFNEVLADMWTDAVAELEALGLR